MQNPLKNRYGIVILAAGNSSRLGRPKQLLTYGDKSLLRHAIDEAVKIVGTNVIVVLGAEAGRIREEIIDTQVKTVENPDWEQGMASSIRTGLSELLSFQPLVDGVILTVCDQPFLSAGILNELINIKANSEKKIVACAYGSTVGTPALFGKKYFPALMRLMGDEGAKILLVQHKDDMVSIPFGLGTMDIDTAEDYERLVSSE